MSKIKPILFSPPMVQAILDKRKTMTRRVMKPQPIVTAHRIEWKGYEANAFLDEYTGFDSFLLARLIVDGKTPYKPDDILWVRETWANAYLNGGPDGFIDAFAYKADGAVSYRSMGKLKFADCKFEDIYPTAVSGWHPSIFMPKNICRIFLRVTGIRAERVQEISPEDCAAEGAEEYGYNVKTGERVPTTSVLFQVLWDAVNEKRDGGAYAWDKNPWVWVISFERTEKPEGFV